MEVIIMMKATRTSNNDLYQENLYQAYYNTPAEKHVVSESLAGSNAGTGTSFSCTVRLY
jgi:hypothetical protein